MKPFKPTTNTVRLLAASAFGLGMFLASPFSLAKEKAEPAKPAPALELEVAPAAAVAAAADTPRIQIALLLDDSGSMGGLLEQARTRLWDIVGDLGNANRDGQKPVLEVALYRHGGPVRQIVEFTQDLDDLSDKLFKTTIQGNGSEHCGEAIQQSVDSLQWSEDPLDLKIIVVAGNEPFTQGPVNYVDACKAAMTKAIVVNTIHCGDWVTGMNQKWKDGADMTQGAYANINANQAVVHIPAPAHDKQLVKLNADFNDTFIAFGKQGAALQLRQKAQDDNAKNANAEVFANRAMCKGGAYYSNAKWDLVDACKDLSIDLKTAKPEQLPENMRKMTVAEREAYVKGMQDKRTTLQKEIQKVTKERREFVDTERKRLAEEAKKTGKKTEQTLDLAIRKAVRNVGTERGFAF